MSKVYIASKLKYAAEWRELRVDWSSHGIDLHARWFEQASLELDGDMTSEDDFRIIWMVDEEDVRDADAVIVYGTPGDKLRGALVEAGMAIALKKLVIVVGMSPDFGTWQHHPCVVRAATLDDARMMLIRRFRRNA